MQGELAEIAEVLLSHIPPLLQRLGIHSIKHLKDVIPLITGVLSDPLSPTHPPLLVAAAKALQSVILNSWPRIAYHRGEVLKGLAICWINLSRENDSFADVKQQLQHDVRLLDAVVQNEAGIQDDFDRLIRADETLRGLFDQSVYPS